MPTNQIHDLYDKKTLYIIGGSKEYFRLSLKNAATFEAIDLSGANNIEWLMTTYSVREKHAVISKSLSDDDIIILKDSEGNYTNTIQVSISGDDTANLQGAFVHQIVITDGDNNRFVPFQGLIVINRGITRI
jgi:hypothetical protein